MGEYYCKWKIQSFVGPNTEFLNWLREHLNRQDWQFHGPGSAHPYTICFQNEEDAVAFKLAFDIDKVNSTN